MDQGMLDCFVGRNKKDMYSMTASGAMRMKWECCCKLSSE